MQNSYIIKPCHISQVIINQNYSKQKSRLLGWDKKNHSTKIKKGSTSFHELKKKHAASNIIIVFQLAETVKIY